MEWHVFCVLLLLPCSNGFGLMGGWKKVDIKSKEVRKVVGYALTELNQRSNSMFRSIPVEIVEARSQVVQGINYDLEVVVGETDCTKSKAVKNIKSCQVSKVQNCKIKVWVREWMTPPSQVTDLNCGSLLDLHKEEKLLGKAEKSDKQPDEQLLDSPVHLPLMPGPVMPGAPMTGDTKDQDVNKAALFFLDDMNAKANSMFRMGLVKVKSVTTQVVAGIKYTMVLTIGPTECLNNAVNVGVGTEKCPVNSLGQAQDCQVVIWDQAWRTPRYQVLESSCGTQTPPNPHVDSTMDQSEVPPKHQDNLIGGDDHMAGGQFRSFQKKYNKVYSSKKEEAKRFVVFQDNLRRIRKLQETELGSATYKVNEFADLTYEEFKKQKLGFRPDMAKNKHHPWPQAKIPKVSIPDNFDWREHNAVTPVKNQGSCGSCWAFSTTGNIEGQWAIKKGQLLSLSEQELVDCDKLDDGCEGGLPSNAYHEIIRIGGLETEKAYPYEGEDEKCHFKKSLAKVDIAGGLNISTNEGDMAAWLFKNGPISIGINAFAMQFYFGGISHPWKIFCNPEELDHGVLIVGYGVKSGEPFWIIKNSWGSSWGEEGYYLVYRGSGVCGLNRMPTSSVVH